MGDSPLYDQILCQQDPLISIVETAMWKMEYLSFGADPPVSLQRNVQRCTLKQAG